MKNNNETEKLADNDELTPEQARRQFMKKYGRLAAVTPIALTALMTPKTSAAPSSNACSKPNPPKQCPSSPNGF